MMKKQVGEKAVIAAVMMGITSCSTDMKTSENIQMVAMDDGVRIVETMSMDATVTAKDSADRKITLMSESGGEITFKAGPEMAHFDQLTVGDKVYAAVTEEIAIHIGAGAPSTSASEGGVMHTAEAVNPGSAFSETHQVMVKVAAVDAARRRITLQLPDGSTRKLKVSKAVDLSDVAVGDNLVAVVSEDLTLEITTP